MLRRDADGRALPRVIRNVTKKDRKGRPKVAYDRKAMIEMARIKAQTAHGCGYYKCPHPNKRIEPGTEYANVILYEKSETIRLGNREVHQPRAYHPDCVPPEARPLVRFLFPLGWVAETWTGYDHGDPVKRLFTSAEAWELWVDKNYPTMREMFTLARPTGERQLGTNDYWSTLRPVSSTK